MEVCNNAAAPKNPRHSPEAQSGAAGPCASWQIDVPYPALPCMERTASLLGPKAAASRGTLPRGPRSRVQVHVHENLWTYTYIDHQRGNRAVGLSWQQGPLSTGAIGRFLVPEPLPKRLLYVEPLRRRMRVR